MVDSRVAAVPRTVKRKGTGLETPNYGSSCKGIILFTLSENIGCFCIARIIFGAIQKQPIFLWS